MKATDNSLSGESIGAEANNTIEVREDLEAHLDYLAEQNNIRRLSDEEALMFATKRVTRKMEACGWDFNQLTEADMRGIVFVDSYSGKSSKTGKMVFYVDPDEHEDALVRYFVGLHEIAHMTLNHGGPERTREQIIEDEIAADEWALEHSIVEPSDEVLCMMQAALGTYTDAYESGAWKVDNSNMARGNSLFSESEMPFNLKGEALDNSVTEEGEKRVRALAEREAHKAQRTLSYGEACADLQAKIEASEQLAVDLKLAAELQATLNDPKVRRRRDETKFCSCGYSPCWNGLPQRGANDVDFSAGDSTLAELEAAAHNWRLVGPDWCKCNNAGDVGERMAYYRDPASGSHGWFCAECRGIVQTG